MGVPPLATVASRCLRDCAVRWLTLLTYGSLKFDAISNLNDKNRTESPSNTLLASPRAASCWHVAHLLRSVQNLYFSEPLIVVDIRPLSPGLCVFQLERVVRGRSSY